MTVREERISEEETESEIAHPQSEAIDSSIPARTVEEEEKNNDNPEIDVAPPDENSDNQEKPDPEIDISADDPEIYVPPSQEGNGFNNNESRNFPDVFYCPITKEIMADPVVMLDGNSYERSSMEDRVPSNKLYPNRALKSVIDETVELSGDSLISGMKRSMRSMRNHLSQVLEKSVIPSEDFRPLSDAYYCPITFNLMYDPVIDPEGNTFEKVAVENWIRHNGNSPITRASVSVEDLYPNKALSALLEEEKSRSDESIHPSIRKWKEEPPPQATDPEVGGALPVTTMPTTPEENNEAERGRKVAVRTLIGLAFALFFVILALMYGNVFIIFYGFICVFIILKSGRRDND